MTTEELQKLSDEGLFNLFAVVKKEFCNRKWGISIGDVNFEEFLEKERKRQEEIAETLAKSDVDTSDFDPYLSAEQAQEILDEINNIPLNLITAEEFNSADKDLQFPVSDEMGQNPFFTDELGHVKSVRKFENGILKGRTPKDRKII